MRRSKENSPEREAKKQRLEQDRVLPLPYPLDPEMLEGCIGVAPDDAWLPLSIALIDRLHRLWNIVSGDKRCVGRIEGDEYLYQVMRTSLLSVFQIREETIPSQRLIKSKLPKNLPTSGKLSFYTAQYQAMYDDQFDAIKNALITDGLKLGITSDPRTVEEVLAAFDARLDRMTIVHLQGVLDETDVIDLSENEQDVLKERIRGIERRLANALPENLAHALAILGRVREIWKLLYQSSDDLRRYDEDEPAYQSYRNLLLKSLADRKYQALHILASELLPRLLPLSHELVETNPLFKDMPSRFERLHYEIVAHGFTIGEPVMVDDQDQLVLDQSAKQAAREWNSLQTAVQKHRSLRRKARASRTRRSERPGAQFGRPPIDLPYDLAARAWWDLQEDFKIPRITQTELSARLSSMGYEIKPRTLRSRIAAWRCTGMKWPPPDPTESS